MSVRSLRYNTMNQHITKSALASTDRDALAFLEAAQIYNTNQQRAIVNLVRSLKRVGLWSKMKAIYPFVGGTATSHKWNLKDPRDVDAAFRLTFSGGWTHSANGALPNGTNAYANTFLSPRTVQTLNDVHYSFYSRTDTNGLFFDLGSSNEGSTQLISIYCREGGAAKADIGSYLQSRISVTVSGSFGYYISKRTANNNFKLFRNGVELGSNTNTDNNLLPERNINLSAVLLNAGYSQYSTRQMALVTIGDGLTDTDATNLYNIVDLYQKRLGRAV